MADQGDPPLGCATRPPHLQTGAQLIVTAIVKEYWRCT
jgi:hypothetical protein